jgi:serine protease Do
VLGDRTTLSEVANGSVLGGIKLAQMDEVITQQFRLPRNYEGVMIKDVEPKSLAEKVGFQSGDILIQIEDVEIKKFPDVQVAIKKYDKLNKRVYVNRFGQTILFVIK